MTEAVKIPERSQIPVEETWNLADLYPSDQAWEQDLEATRTMAQKLPGYAGRLGESAGTLYEYVELEQRVGEHLTELANYAQRKCDQDTRVAENQAIVGKVMSLYVEISSATAFETPELLKIPQETLEQFYRDKPELELYRRYFQIVQDQKEHILSDAEEKLLAAAGEMAQAPDDIYGKLTNADLIFPDAVDGQGNAVPLSDGSFVPTQMSEDRALRENAFKTYYKTYGTIRRRGALRPGQAAAVLRHRPEVRQLPGRRRGRHPGAPPGVPQPHRHGERQPGQAPPLCPPAQEAAGGGRAPHVRHLRPHGVRRGQGHPLPAGQGHRL